MANVKATIRRAARGPTKTAWRVADKLLPGSTATDLERRAKRALKRHGLVGPVPIDLPAHEPMTALPSAFPDDDVVECPICGCRDPFGDVNEARPAARCPRCGSVERHRMVWLYFGLRTNLFTEPVSMLHLAPEAHIGTYLRRQAGLRYLSADLEISAAMVEMDVTDIDRPDASFDVVYASHVLEHVPDDQQAMRELRRVLRPDGWALLLVPMWGPTTREDPTVTDPAERARRFGQFDHVRMYGHDGTFERRLHEAGFDVTVERFADELGPAATRRYRLPTDEFLYRCRPR